MISFKKYATSWKGVKGNHYRNPVATDLEAYHGTPSLSVMVSSCDILMCRVPMEGSVYPELRKENKMPSSVLRFSWTLTGKGWIETSLSDNMNHLTLTTSYLSDSVTDLLWIVLSLLKGAEEGRCVWQQEPGEYRWLFSRQDEKIEIRILRFQETFSRQSDEQGECLLVLTCSLLKFATKIHKQLHQLLLLWGEEGYQREWGYPFPKAEWQQLKALLSSARSLSQQE